MMNVFIFPACNTLFLSLTSSYQILLLAFMLIFMFVHTLDPVLSDELFCHYSTGVIIAVVHSSYVTV